MIRIEHLNKFYNRGKQNEIHAINDTSLAFPEKGLVALTGPSGCGKTTLLNVIGGLDKFDSGTIDFDGTLIKSYKPEQWDMIRNASVGYIFQNYNLVEDKTVFENIQIALNMAGLYKTDAVEERIDYVLKSVGMYNYRRRNVQALSGGQQQRVAIARAIAKNPKVVLADEPTGNLDTNNTFEIMSIIKKISETCLVILVSHERELVDFYSDRVIEILDGKVVKDYENVGNRTLEHIDDRNIYLKDLEMKKSVDLCDLEFYYEGQQPSQPKVKLVYLNDTLYVKVEAGTKIKYLSADSEIKLIDDHYKKPETDDISTYLFDLNQFGEIKTETKQKSFVRFRDTLKAGFLKFLNGRKFLSRFFVIVCFVVACTLVYNLASLSAMMKESSFLTAGRNFIQVEITEDFAFHDVEQILTDTVADSVVTVTEYSWYTFRYENYYQGSGLRAASASLYQGSSICPVPVSLSQIDPDAPLIAGVLPTTNREVAIDVWIADQLLANPAFIKMGITGYSDLLGVTIAGSNNVLGTLEVVGIVQTESPVVVVTDANRFFFSASATFASLGSAAGEYTLLTGADPVDINEVLVSDIAGMDVGDIVAYNGNNFEITGTFAEEAPFTYVFTDAGFERMVVEGMIAQSNDNYFGNSVYYLYFYSSDPAQAIAEITALGFTALDTYDYLKAQNNISMFQKLIFVYVGLAGTLVYIVFMMRSSMLSRIKEIGIYRSIGATKRDIYKIFFSEIFAFTSIGSLPGYLFMSYVVLYIQDKFNQLLAGTNALFYFPLPTFFLGLLGLYVVNIVFGMIPIFTLLRKTPSEINTKYDI